MAKIPDNAPTLQPSDLPPPPPAAPEEISRATKPAVAELEFLDPAALSKTVPLDFPFRRDGVEVREIVVHRLSIAEIGDVVQAMSTSGDPDLWDFYAAMTGFPKDVLRALRDEAVIDACSPFLPRVARDLFFAPTPASGGATPSPSPAPPTSR